MELNETVEEFFTATLSNFTSSNSTDNGTAKDSTFSSGFYMKTDDYVVGTVFITMSVVGIIFNFCTIFIIGFGRSTSGEVKIQLINMAVADLLTAMTFPLTKMDEVLQLPFPRNPALCRFTRFFGQTVLHASPLSSAAISIERFVIVFFPFRASLYTRTHKYICVVIIWLCAILPELEVLPHAQVLSDHVGPYCQVASNFREEKPILYEWLVTMKYFVPLSIIFVCYTAVFIKLALQKRNQLRCHSTQRMNSQMEKVQVMLVVDAMLTLATWLPYNLYVSIITESIDEFYEMYTDREVFAMEASLGAIMATNAFSTPVVYYIFNGRFRKDTKLFFQRFSCSSRIQSTLQKFHLHSASSTQNGTTVCTNLPLSNFSPETATDKRSVSSHS